MNEVNSTDLTTQVCIAGGGPAGLMLGVLLARAGVRVHVLEKHADFLRDFRGDTIHPSTLEVMHELGWLDEFLKLPHQKVHKASTMIGAQRVDVADFSHLPVQCGFIALMPQWDFLNFLAEKGRGYPGFRLDMGWEATDLIMDCDNVAGVRIETAEGRQNVHAALAVACDGRGSILRDKGGFDVERLGVPIDALWFRVSRRAEEGEGTLGRFQSGRILIKFNRGDYWQCAFIIEKGGREALEREGIERFRDTVAELGEFAGEQTAELKTWDDVKLLRVQVNRLKTWFREGMLCIGDAAHAMSPVGGVGVNLAIQDAVAAANILASPLRSKTLNSGDLAAVQARRERPTRVTQALQIKAQNRIIAPLLNAQGDVGVPLPLRLLLRFPFLQRIPARFIGLGWQPEHVSEEIRAGKG